MDDEMTRAGWRPLPAEPIKTKLESMGLCWQRLDDDSPCIVDPRILYAHWSRLNDIFARPWRPIDPLTWTHAAWMWAELTGDDMTPTEPGWYWWRQSPLDTWQAAEVCLFSDGVLRIDDEYKLEHGYITDLSSGKWGGPCLGMPGGSK